MDNQQRLEVFRQAEQELTNSVSDKIISLLPLLNMGELSSIWGLVMAFVEGGDDDEGEPE